MSVLRWLAISLVLLLVGPISVLAGDVAPRDAAKKAFVRPAAIPFPADDPYEAQKAHLGQMLFFEPRLSGSKWISCATCHNPSLSWGDGLPRGIGAGMKSLGRRTPTILNLAWADLVMWD